MQSVLNAHGGWDVLAGVGAHPGEQRQGDTGDGRVYSGGVYAYPHTQGQWDVEQRRGPPPPLGERIAAQQEHGRAQPDRFEPAGEQDGYQDDGADVVDDRQAQQQHPHRGGQIRPDQGQHTECEGDVGGHRDRPAVRRPRRTPGDRQEHQSRDDHPAERRDHRQHSGAGVGELPDDEFPFELKARDEEEHREQAVGHPRPGAQMVQMQPGRAEAQLGIPDLPVRAAGHVRPHQGDQGGSQQQEATGGLLAEELGELLTARQNLWEAGMCGHSRTCHGCPSGNVGIGRRPDFPAHL